MPVSVSGNELGFTLTAPDASTVSCRQTNTGQYDCPTSQAGTYTLAVGNGGNDYTLDFTALLSDANCTAINLAFNQPAIAGSLAAGQTGTCYTLDVPAGSVLDLTRLTSSGFSTALDVYDSTGANQNCNLLGANTCAVGGTGPYRIFDRAGHRVLRARDRPHDIPELRDLRNRQRPVPRDAVCRHLHEL
jgi:hypothetical protein